MDDVWATRETVTCIHPGWAPLRDREAVMESWEAILGNPESPEIRCEGANAHVLGEAAYVLCYEMLDGGLLVATNVFVREDKAWRMVHHQAGPGRRDPEEEDEEPPPARVQ